MNESDPYAALEQFYPALIARMPPRFNSHEFILRLAYEHQGLYIRALAQYADSDHPFMAAHARLARALARFPDLVRYVGDEPSVDIFGHTGQAALWRRVK